MRIHWLFPRVLRCKWQQTFMYFFYLISCNTFSTAQQKSTLLTHQRIHSDEKTFKCQFEGCNYATRQVSLMLVAMTCCYESQFAAVTTILIFLCCCQRGNLTSHERFHTGSRPFVCDFPLCESSFTQVSSYPTPTVCFVLHLCLILRPL